VKISGGDRKIGPNLMGDKFVRIFSDGSTTKVTT